MLKQNLSMLCDNILKHWHKSKQKTILYWKELSILKKLNFLIAKSWVM